MSGAAFVARLLRRRFWRAGPAALALVLPALPAPAAPRAPSAPVELVVPAGGGGGADQMARFIAKLVAERKLMAQPITVVNKPGNSGVEGLQYLKAEAGNPHRLVITLSNLFTAPLASGVDFSWRELTPVQLLALDQFVLWVNAASPYKTTQDLVAALRAAPPGSLKLGGTGAKQEDQLISVLMQSALGVRLSYVPLKGGGDVARALASAEVDMTVNNPIEAEALWRDGSLRPLCVFDGERLAYPAKLAGARSWADLPTCMSQGLAVQYLMMRGIFTTPGATPEQLAFYNQLFDKLRALPEWRAFMDLGAFKQTAMAGAEFGHWLDKADSFHRVLMREAGFKAPPPGAVLPAEPVKPAAAAAAKKK